MLQLDPSNQYGGSWASLRLNEFADLLQSGGGNGTADGPANGAASEAAAVAAEAASSGSDSAEAAEAAAQQLAAAGIRGVGAEVWRRPWAELGPAHQYSLDLAPKARCRALSFFLLPARGTAGRQAMFLAALPSARHVG